MKIKKNDGRGGGAPERARFNQCRHCCNGCNAIFDCVPCKHTKADTAVFCSTRCETKQKKAEAPRPVRQESTFDRYLKRAGIGRS